MQYNYYYNNVPGQGLCRNNLIYTSLISEDQKSFVQWYHNDSEYHKGQNEVVDPDKMNEKWEREVNYLTLMNIHYPDLVPKHTINVLEKKIYLEIDGVDFWERAGCLTENYDSVLPNWREQLTEIIKAHKSLGLFKYSLHPSSYFIVDGKLKSINYFFTYHKDETPFSLHDVESHISTNRRNELRKYMESQNINWNDSQDFRTIELLAWDSFRNNYPSDFVDMIKCIN